MSQSPDVTIAPNEAAEQYIKSRRGDVREKTIQTQRSPVFQFAQWCETNDRELAELNGLDLQIFYDSLKERDLKRITRRMYMTAVRQFLLWLERVEAAPDGIADKVHRPVLEKSERKRDTEIEPERVSKTIDWLDKFKYASRDHVVMLILWHCGVRTGSLHSLDLEDYKKLNEIGPVLQITHRPDNGTPLKNGLDGERPVNLSAQASQVIQDYIDHQRIENTDEAGREPLLTTKNGRLSKSVIRSTCYLYTCPQTTSVGSCGCDEKRIRENARECEESVSPHVIRASSITHWRSKDVPVEVVSDRMNVSRDIIKEHYDRRTDEGKAAQRKKYLNDV